MLYAGLLALSLSLGVTGLAFYGLIGFDGAKLDTGLLSDPYFHSVVGFSIKQAALSALLAVLLAWPVARALHYSPGLWGRRGFLSLCVLCFVMPTLILITGLVALLGRQGLISPWLGPDWNLYGLPGILIAHLYLNLPFAVRVQLLQLQHIPDNSWKLAAQLKLGAWQRLRLIEWPALRAGMLQLFGFIFVLCFNSFAVVLALGGGPRATTLEVAIYQSLKYDFNIPEALTLAWTQLLIAGGLFLLLSRLGGSDWLGVDSSRQRWVPRPGALMTPLHRLVYGLATLALLLPLLALLPAVLQVDLAHFDWLAIARPALITLVIAALAGSGALLLAYAMLLPLRHARARQRSTLALLFDWFSVHALVAPAMVVSVGLYILLLPRLDLEAWGMLWVILLNLVLIVPYAVQQLRPRLLQFDRQYHRLARSLKLTPLAQLRIEWPYMRRACVTSFALMLLLAMGDVAIFSIFGSSDWTTLPWLIYGYAGTYRMAEASVASLLLLLICALLVWLFQYFEKGRQDA
ncbi:ABC transporter permease subunit [Marinobacterium rhizophilum]|uniref:ABC transporter permease subunit n=2 Tax=Marinobacterium rhizophilum TaxID=420402 RepID=A0ABY5HQP4_9GAMM|nr:ABC transporter permease subunit [Marinobacterium rhizophilum]